MLLLLSEILSSLISSVETFELKGTMAILCLPFKQFSRIPQFQEPGKGLC